MIAYYLGGVNLVGFLAALMCCAYLAWGEAGEGNGVVDVVLGLLAVCGGALGIALAFLGFYLAANRATMLTRVIVACSLVIDAVVALAVSGHVRAVWNWNVVGFFGAHEWLLWVLGAVNVVVFLAFAIDKRAAIRGSARVKIVTLLGLSFFGGSVGALLGMHVFHHKARKNYFYIGVPLMLVMQLVVLWFAMSLL